MGRHWEEKVTTADRVMKLIRPGMSIFIGTGVAEPRTLVKALMSQNLGNLQDLEIVQLVSFGDAISLQELRSQKYRLKTFFSGWVSREAIEEGQVDLVPSRFVWIPRLIESDLIPVNAAFVQITQPDESGNCSLGVAVDVARQAMEKAQIVVGEINRWIPRTFGDTFVHVSDFTHLIEAKDAPIFFERWPVDDVYRQVADNVSAIIENGSCIAFSIGPLFEALGRSLAHRKHLGVHSPFFTDSLMDLVQCGAVTNRCKGTYRGKSLASYAFGSRQLLEWLDQNPLVEFQSVDKVFDPGQIGRNSKFVATLPARKVDLLGKIALQIGRGNVATGPTEVLDFIHGAESSPGGRTIFALPSRNARNDPNILISVRNYPNQFQLCESVDMVVTEYGAARLRGYSLRERAQALVDIAHPDDRPLLIERARNQRIIYSDQVFIPESAYLYPFDIDETHTFKNDIRIRFRPIKPSDEEEMRRLFYRFSDKTVYYRYFGHVKSMPHAKIQDYVNIDWSRTMSIVGVAESDDQSRVIAEARYIKQDVQPLAEVVFVVDEAYQGLGIASFLFGLLMRLARERGVEGFTADVLYSNQAMMKVFRKGASWMKTNLQNGIYQVEIPLAAERAESSTHLETASGRQENVR